MKRDCHLTQVDEDTLRYSECDGITRCHCPPDPPEPPPYAMVPTDELQDMVDGWLDDLENAVVAGDAAADALARQRLDAACTELARRGYVWAF